MEQEYQLTRTYSVEHHKWVDIQTIIKAARENHDITLRTGQAIEIANAYRAVAPKSEATSETWNVWFKEQLKLLGCFPCRQLEDVNDDNDGPDVIVGTLHFGYVSTPHPIENSSYNEDESIPQTTEFARSQLFQHLNKYGKVHPINTVARKVSKSE